jgi:hypothetical protein
MSYGRSEDASSTRIQVLESTTRVKVGFFYDGLSDDEARYLAGLLLGAQRLAGAEDGGIDLFAGCSAESKLGLVPGLADAGLIARPREVRMPRVGRFLGTAGRDLVVLAGLASVDRVGAGLKAMWGHTDGRIVALRSRDRSDDDVVSLYQGLEAEREPSWQLVRAEGVVGLQFFEGAFFEVAAAAGHGEQLTAIARGLAGALPLVETTDDPF